MGVGDVFHEVVAIVVVSGFGEGPEAVRGVVSAGEGRHFAKLLLLLTATATACVETGQML
jgi:hypothetical protein